MTSSYRQSNRVGRALMMLSEIRFCLFDVQETAWNETNLLLMTVVLHEYIVVKNKDYSLGVYLVR